jgi:hypothetical protein
VFVFIFSKRPAGHGKGLRGPRVEDPCFKGFIEECEGLGDDASSEKLSTAKNLEMIWLAENR